jgi:hypothetical protein
MHLHASNQVWPTQVRDLCLLVHWRLLTDGRLVITSFSERHDELCPVEDANIRAELVSQSESVYGCIILYGVYFFVHLVECEFEYMYRYS